jgi:hypothetical protein
VIADVAEELRELARSSVDASGYFCAMYARVTSNIATSIAQGRFEDGERMERFASIFAGYYTRGHGPAPVRPRCWQASFDVAGRGDMIILQHLLIGINAHVNHDLPQATVDVAQASGDLASVRGDFEAINDLLGSMTNDLLRDLDRVSRWSNEAGSLGGGRLFNFSLQRARDQAWSAAQRLYGMSETERAAEKAELDRLVSVLAYLISEPTLPGRLLVKLARRFEERDPKLVTAALLGDRSRS